MRTKTHAVLVAAALVAATLSACGSDDDDAATTAGATTTTAEATATTAPQPDKPAADPGPGQKPPPEPAPQELTTFSTPSGNIGCAMDTAHVRCDIRDRSWEPPPEPADCELDFGHGIELGSDGKPSFVCAGDTTLGAADVLEYGQTSRVGPFRCVSAAAGITCQADDGHGFFLSKQAYELY